MSELIRDAVSRGARVLCGGHPRPISARTSLSHGYRRCGFLDEAISRETFGPIFALQSVRDAESAIARANDSPFALSASVGPEIRGVVKQSPGACAPVQSW